MRMVLLAIIFCSSFASASLEPVGQLGGGYCAVDKTGIHCFYGARYRGDPPVVKNPRSLTSGQNQTCFIGDDGAHCWGYDNKTKEIGTLELPPLKNPRMISAGGNHMCALDDEGVQCWGDNEYGQIDVPPLKNPKAVALGQDITYALDDDGVKVWGRLELVQSYKIPVLVNPRFIVVNHWDGACVIDDEGVKCWGLNSLMPTPSMKNPRIVSVGIYHACALDDEGVHCWGDNKKGQLNVPLLKDPYALASIDDTSCALDINGIQCWGKLDDGKGNWLLNPPYLRLGPIFSKPYFTIDETAEFLNVISLGSASARRALFSEMAVFADKNITENSVADDGAKKSAYMLLTHLMGPAILTADSTYFLDSVIPVYNDCLRIWEYRGYFRDLSQIPGSPLNQQIALKVIQSTLSAMKDFVSSTDQIEIEKLILLIGKATANPSAQAVQEVLNTLKTQDGIFAKLNASSKTAFLVVTVKTSASWLEGVK